MEFFSVTEENNKKKHSKTTPNNFNNAFRFKDITKIVFATSLRLRYREWGHFQKNKPGKPGGNFNIIINDYYPNSAGPENANEAKKMRRRRQKKNETNEANLNYNKDFHILSTWHI